MTENNIFDNIKDPGPKPEDPGPEPEKYNVSDCYHSYTMYKTPTLAYANWYAKKENLYAWIYKNKRYQLARICHYMDDPYNSSEQKIRFLEDAVLLVAAMILEEE